MCFFFKVICLHSVSSSQCGIITIIKTCSTGPSWKNKVVYKLLSQPIKHLLHRKLKKTQLREATNGWLPLEPIQLSGIYFVWVVSQYSGDRPMSPQFQKVNTPHSSMFGNYRQISVTPVLSKVFGRLVSVRLSRLMENSRCASNHLICLSERSGYLWCTFVCVPYTAMFIGVWAGG